MAKEKEKKEERQNVLPSAVAVNTNTCTHVYLQTDLQTVLCLHVISFLRGGSYTLVWNRWPLAPPAFVRQILEYLWAQGTTLGPGEGRQGPRPHAAHSSLVLCFCSVLWLCLYLWTVESRQKRRLDLHLYRHTCVSIWAKMECLYLLVRPYVYMPRRSQVVRFFGNINMIFSIIFSMTLNVFTGLLVAEYSHDLFNRVLLRNV